MLWSWVWIGNAFLVGLYAGIALMCLLAIAKETRNGPWDNEPCRAQTARTLVAQEPV